MENHTDAVRSEKRRSVQAAGTLCFVVRFRSRRRNPRAGIPYHTVERPAYPANWVAPRSLFVP